jgi:integrase
MRLRLTEKQIEKRISAGVKQSITIAPNTVLDIHNIGIATFSFRGQIDGERKQFKIGTYGNNGAHFLTIEQAIKKATDMKRLVLEGIDPRWAHYGETINTTDDLFSSFFATSTCSYEYDKKMYEKYIKPTIGDIKPQLLTAKHLQLVLKNIVDQGRLSIAERSLYLFRSVFSDAFENSIINKNIARKLDPRKHAGADMKKHREALTEMHLKTFFDEARQHPEIFPETTLIALSLLLIFGFRKMELLAAKWSDIDWEQQELHIWVDRSKNKLAIAVPLPDCTIPLFQRLKEVAMYSDYIFPSRRRGNTPHLHDSTLNAAINNLFGKNKRNKAYQEDILGKLGVPYFYAHDLRRTFRTLLPKFDTPEKVCESCLNHKPRGISAVYNRYKYLNQRRNAHDKMAKVILPLAGFEYKSDAKFKQVRECKISTQTNSAVWENNNYDNVA